MAQEEGEMRRSTKASGSGAKAKKRTTHLDLSLSNDDQIAGGGKIHKRKGTSKSTIAVSILCAIAALGTLLYVSKRVFDAPGTKTKMGSGKADVSRPVVPTQKERFTMAQQNRLLPPDSIYRTSARDIHGEVQQLMQYSGSVSLVVNVACECGLTKSNYQELAVLGNRYASRGFNILAFPSNDFRQEKETDAEILDYVRKNFPQVNFPLFSRAPLASNMVFRLCQKHTGEGVQWNFHKYLVNGQGLAIKSYGHRVQPMDIEADIVALLNENEKQKMQLPQIY